MTLHLIYTSRDLTVSVSDDGSGLSDGITSGTKERHWGIAGMKERAERIGARYRLSSTPGKGCTVTVTVAASVAYRDYLTSFSTSWLDRLRIGLQRRWLNG